MWNAVNVGGGLLPIAMYQSDIYRLTDRNREQAPSHICLYSQSEFV